MSNLTLDDLNINSEQPLITPAALRQEIPLSETGTSAVLKARQDIQNILDRKDHRFIVVTGPCSIHDSESALEYAKRLKKLQDRYSESLYIVMRVYFEKPRTTVGWKGFINDPYLDDSFCIDDGLAKARKLLVDLAEMGMPTGTEALDPISPQYFADLFAWSAIGARTTESQTHREMASGLSMPVGFKNGTDGSLSIAINAMESAASPHRFLGINHEGQVSVLRTSGNPHGHVILRGGKEPNYDSVHIAKAEQALNEAGLTQNLIVDCSHANSHKKHEEQPLVAKNVIDQVINGNQSIMGVMLESHLHEGNQKLTADLSKLAYGVSITDACISWETTETLLEEMTNKLAIPLKNRLKA